MPYAEFFAVVSDPSLPFGEKMQEMLRVGCKYLGFEAGVVARVMDDRYEVLSVAGPDDFGLHAGDTLALEETYCREVIHSRKPVGCERVSESGLDPQAVHAKLGIESYLGARIRVCDAVYGTLSFVSREPRSASIGEGDYRSISQLAHWIGCEFERQELHGRLAESDQFMRSVFETLREGVMVFASERDDAGEIVDFRWIDVNSAGARIAKRKRSELVGSRLLEVAPGVGVDGLFAAYKRVVETGEVFETEHYYSHEYLDAWYTLSASKLGDGFVLGFADISELRRAQQEAEGARDELQMILDNVPAMVWYKDIESRVLRVNSAVANAMGLPREQIEGQTTWDLHPREAQGYCRDDREVMETGRARRGIVEKVMMSPADARWVSTDKIPILSSRGASERLLVVSMDITRQKRTEETLRHALERDQLTGLVNRETLVRTIQECMQTGGNRTIAVAMLDFDRFKAVNDSLGHHAGDELLRLIAERLRSHVRSSDLVARLGGDEFAVLVRDVRDQAAAVAYCERLRAVCDAPYQIQGHTVASTASIGVAHSSLGFAGVDSMIAAADGALYAAKKGGRNLVRSVDVQELAAVQARARIAEDLRALLEGKGLEHLYQPIVSAESGEAVGVEIQARWPGGTVDTSDLFVAIAEANLEVAVSTQTLQAGLVPMFGGRLPGGFLAAKIGRRELLHPDFERFVRVTLDEMGSTPERLVLEIDERTFSDVRADVHTAIERLQRSGVRVAIENFGMGATSLSELQRAPVDIVKLDRRLLNHPDGMMDMAAIASALTTFARQLGITVIAEGVETTRQLAMLQALDIEQWQGPLASPALPLLELQKRYGTHRAA